MRALKGNYGQMSSDTVPRPSSITHRGAEKLFWR
jgi:hypothetical protein